VPRTALEESVVVADLASELPVTPSATTSRVVIANDAVRVVAFAFDVGEELTEHTSTMPVVVQLVRGALRFGVGGATHELTAGDTVYLAPDEPHSLEALEPSLVTLVMIRRPRPAADPS
jgi:quercetin dioxygenase-like cupin family protein